MRKKISVTISERRKPSSFFGRVKEIFERKFDGFPAVPADPSGLEGYTTGDLGTVDQKQIVDEISKLIQKQTINFDTAPCPDYPCTAETANTSGTVCVSDMSTTNYITYTPVAPAKYYVNVYVDGTPMLINIDYTVVSGNVVFGSALSQDADVRARFVVA